MFDARPDLNSSFHGDPIVTEDLVVFDADLPKGHVYAVDRKTGELRWSRQLAGRINTPPTPIDGHVYVGSAAKTMYRLDAATGAVERKLVLPGIAYGNPTSIYDRIVVSVYQNTFVCLDRDLTRMIW